MPEYRRIPSNQPRGSRSARSRRDANQSGWGQPDRSRSDWHQSGWDSSRPAPPPRQAPPPIQAPPPRQAPLKNESPLAKIAFFTFMVAGVVYLLQSILSKLGAQSNILQTLQNVIIILLFTVTGFMGWRYCRTKKFYIKLLYLVSVIIIIVAVVLPII